MESASGGQLGGGFENAGHDHGHGQITLGAAGASEDGLQTEAAESAQRSSDVTVRRRAENLEGIGGGGEGFVFEHAAQRINLRCRPSGQVGDGAFHNLAVAARGFTEQDGRRGAAIRNGLERTWDHNATVPTLIQRLFALITWVQQQSPNYATLRSTAHE